MDLVDELAPDILVLGFGTPVRAALNSLAWVRAERLPVRIIVGASEMSRSDVVEAMTLNVDGIVPGNAPDEEILTCFQAVAEGQQWLSPLIREIAAGRVTWDGRLTEDPFRVLTAREVEVALEVASGTSNQQAAENLGIKLYTLKLHLHRIYARLRVANRRELAQLAARRPVPAVEPGHKATRESGR